MSEQELLLCKCGNAPNFVNDNGGVYLSCSCGMRTRTSGELSTVIKIWNEHLNASDTSRERIEALEADKKEILDVMCDVLDETGWNDPYMNHVRAKHTGEGK